MLKFLAALALAVLGLSGTAAAQTSKYGIPTFHAPLTGAVQLPTTTVAKLPNCDAQGTGILYVVTDASSPTYNGSLTGGGNVIVPVMCTGSGWKSH